MKSSLNQKRVVLMIADDWGALGGCYGDSAPRTPRIDELARQGTTFHRAYCSSPSCGPSRANILTGLHSYTHGQYGNPHGTSAFRVDRRVHPLTLQLKEAGARTGLIGKQHIMPLDHFAWDFTSPSEKVITRERTLEDIQSFLEIAGQEDFFLMLAPFLPHRTSPDGFDHPNYSGLALQKYDPSEVNVPDFLPDLPEVREDLANYYSAITRFDEWVGLVLDDFRRRGLYEDTLFLVLSDHGMPFLGAKASPFEGGQRCPLIACCPGLTASPEQHSLALVSWLDLAPTIADWLGAKPRDEWTGTSLKPLIMGQKIPRDEVYLSHMFHGLVEYYPYRIVCRQRWKYILRLAPELPLPVPADLVASKSFRAILAEQPEFLGKRRATDTFFGPSEVLYDLENDPAETVNLVDDPSCAEILQSMRTAMQTHRENTKDPMLQKANQKEWQAVYPRTN